MTEASPRGPQVTRALHRAALIPLLVLAGIIAGCWRERPQAQTPAPIDGSLVHIVAYLDTGAACQQGTIDLLHRLEAEHPARLEVSIVDVNSPDGRRRWEESGLDAIAIMIDESTTVSWGEGDGRRTVSFLHPAGFAWTHEDLSAAVRAALAGRLRTADPAEAEGVRLMHVKVRGQSIRVGDEGAETGQLIIGERIVLEVSRPHGERVPGERVSRAAAALSRVLEKPFTPNRLMLRRVEDGVALTAGEEQLIVATTADAGDGPRAREELADRWRRSIREALIEAALQRSAAPATPPTDRHGQPEPPLANPLKPALPSD